MLPLILTRTFLKLFLRDRQAIFFSLFFPILFMVIFGFVSDAEPDALAVGVVNTSDDANAGRFLESLENNPAFQVRIDSEAVLRQALIEGDLALVLVVPERMDGAQPADLRVLVDAAQVRQLALIMPALQQGLVTVERDLRNLEPMFDIQVEDVEARSQRYIDFLVPGLLAMSVLTLSLAGSAFNIVEYRRKGILKRLFVTPLLPRDFIIGVVLSRGLICVAELALLLAIAWFYLDVSINGSLFNLLLITIAGAAVFLCMGFCVGSIAKTQQTVGAMGNLVIFPQVFLSGIFYPIDSLPGFLQPLAEILPLSFLANGMRDIIIEGSGLLALLPQFIGLAVWGLLMLTLAVRMFVWKEVAA